MNALHQLHEASNESLARRLHDAMRNLRGGSGGISTASEKAAGGDAVSPDAAGIAEPGSDIAGGKGAGVRAGQR